MIGYFCTTLNTTTLRIVWKIIKRSLLAIVFLLLLLYITIHLTPVQNWIIRRVSASLSEKLHTTVSIRHIDLSLFNKMKIKGLLVHDLHKDTLLYAGEAAVEITDWFFLKDKATIQYLSLKDATVNMKRSDSVWNYQFLVDYFSSPHKDTVQKKGLQLDLKTLHLEHIVFNKIDGWKGKNVYLSVSRLDLDADQIRLSRNKIIIRKLDMDEPSYAEYFYHGNRPPVVVTNIDTATVHASTAPVSDSNEFVLSIGQLHLNSGAFSSISEGAVPRPHTFNGSYIHFSSITGDIHDLLFENDSLIATIELSARERCGLEVKKIDARMKFTPEILEFSDLDLQLNRSRLRNYYAMHFHHFGEDMHGFLHKVTMKADFQHTLVSSDDIAFFAPELNAWKKTFTIQGQAYGPVDNLVIKQTMVTMGKTIVDGDIELRGLPDIDHTYIDFKSDRLQTNYRDVTTIVPALKKIQEPQLSKLTDIRFKGSYTGFIKDFVAFGNIQTNLGNLTADINLKFPANAPAIYRGKIVTSGFNLGAFLNNSKLGMIGFNGSLHGEGFSINDLNTELDGTVGQLQFSGYNYQNITLKGTFRKKLFDGTLQVNDPNFKLNNLHGSIDLNNAEPQFNFDADLAHADLQALNLSSDHYVINGLFHLDFKGSNIDNFSGIARVYNASILHNDLPLPFDSLTLISSRYDGDNKKSLSLSSNELKAQIEGKFSIMELPDAFKIFLNRYYPAYIKKPSYAVSDQDFTFKVDTKSIDDYIPLLAPKLNGFSNATISGSLNLKNNALTINATIPQFGYADKLFNNIRLRGNGNGDTLTTRIDVDDIQLSDSLHLPSSRLIFTSHNDVSDLSIRTSASQTLNNASLHAEVQTLADGVNIRFQPSSFIVNDKKWELEKDGQLSVTHTQVNASNIKLTQGYQQITVATKPSDSSTINDIIVDFSKLNIGDIAPYIVKSPRLEGLTSGNITIADIYHKPSFNYSTTTEQFRLDGDSMGVIKTKGDFSAATGLLNFSADADNKDYQFSAKGSFNIHDSVNNQADIAFNAQKFDLSLLNNYLGSVFSEISGTANTSDLRISGNSRHLIITGKATVYDASMRVNYTQCKYSFNNQVITFTPDAIDLGTIEITDSLKNTGTVSGVLHHTFFNNFSFSGTRLQTRKLLLLNTTRKDNDQFYGKVIGNATMTLDGPVTNMIMDITGEPSLRDSSHIYLLGNNSIESGTIDYIDFIQYGKKMKASGNGSGASNILVNMNLTANTNCKVDVILDETTGDVIQGTGTGKLNIRVGSTEPLTIRGRYDIDKGSYVFNFQTFLNKYFTLTGGNIVWTGDPYKADIDIFAEYLATNVDFGTLGNLTSSSLLNSANSKSDVRIIAHLTEKLDKPKINFEFQLPDNSPIISGSSSFFIVKRLQEFQNDENEMNKQVTSVLLFNSFIDNSQSFLNAGSGYSVLSSTIGGVVSGIVSDRFNKLLEKYVKNTSFYLNSMMTSSNDLAQNVAKLQAAVKSGLVITLLNGRLVISAGVNLDYNDPYALMYSNTTSLFVTPDFTAEFLLSKDGRVRIIGFNKTSFDYTGQRNRSGLKLTYDKDFDLFPELFNSDSRKRYPPRQRKNTKD